MEITPTIGFVLGFILAALVVPILIRKIVCRGRLSWGFAEKSARKMAEGMKRDNFSPTLIAGVGHGGAVMGSLISAALGYKPIIAIDREQFSKNGGFRNGLIGELSVDPKSQKVLLVFGEVCSGGTLRSVYKHFLELGVKEIKRAALYHEKGSPVPVEYVGIESAHRNFRMPWENNR